MGKYNSSATRVVPVFDRSPCTTGARADSMLLRALAPLALILLHTHSLEAQRGGGFRISGDGYATTARLLPDNGDPAGELTWHCASNDWVEVRLGPEVKRRPLVSYV